MTDISKMTVKRYTALYVMLLFMYAIAYNLNWRGNSNLWYSVSMITILMLAYYVIRRRKIQDSFFVNWMFVFYAFCLISIIWAPNKTFSNSLKTLLLIFIVSILLMNIVDDKEGVVRLMKVNYIAIVLCGIYVLFVVDRSMLGSMRISSTMENMWNSNDVSTVMCFGAILSLYFYKNAKSIFNRIINGGAFLLLAIIVFYCGSRTGFILLLAEIILYMIIESSGIKKIGAILGVVVILTIVYCLILYYEPFYNVLGSRLENVLDGLWGSGTNDGSFNLRTTMIISGWNWFLERPILGYGIGNFQYLLGGAYGIQTYSHNNFIEILVSGGIIGFAVYYSIYFYVIKNLWKDAIKYKDSLAVCLLVMNLSKLIVQISSVTYYSTDTYVMLLLAALYIKIRNREKENDYSRSVKPPARSFGAHSL